MLAWLHTRQAAVWRDHKPRVPTGAQVFERAQPEPFCHSSGVRLSSVQVITTKELPYAGSTSPTKHSTLCKHSKGPHHQAPHLEAASNHRRGSGHPATAADRSTAKEHGSNHARGLKKGMTTVVSEEPVLTHPWMGHSWCQSEHSADLCWHGKGAPRTAHQQPLNCQQQLAPSPHHHTGPPHATPTVQLPTLEPAAAGLPPTAAH